MEPKIYECYPIWIVLVFNLAIWSLHIAGLYLTYLISPVLMVLFLAYIFYLEFSVYREGCRYCYYYGKLCASGRGKIAKLFVKKGDPKKFGGREIGWKDLIPSFLENILTLAAGMYLLIQQFSWLILGLTLWPLIVFVSNQITFGELGCPHCKQGQINCPVCEFFKKQAKKGK